MAEPVSDSLEFDGRSMRQSIDIADADGRFRVGRLLAGAFRASASWGSAVVVAGQTTVATLTVP